MLLDTALNNKFLSMQAWNDVRELEVADAGI